MIRRTFFVVMFTHGLIHFMGFAKAFGLAELPQLAQPISRVVGVLWLLAGLALIATAVLFIAGNGFWWAVGFGALALSQIVIVTSWNDAWFGTIANGVLLAILIYGFASQGPFSFRAAYRRAVDERLTPSPPLRDSAGTESSLITESDLAGLPEPVRRYLRATRSVGLPRVRHFSALWHGRIRSGPENPWMPFAARQFNVVERPVRFFLMDAVKGGLPVDVFHAFRDGAATMRVRLLSLFPIVDMSGPELTRAETVTLLNDLCVLAPAALVDAPIRWQAIDGHSARAVYTVGSNTVSATLVFNDQDELIDFVSDDRLALSNDGKRFTRQRWSTPLREYRDFGDRRVSALGQARWHAPEGDFTYIESVLVSLSYAQPL